MDRYLDLGGFWDEFDDRVDIVVTDKHGVTSFFYNIKPGVTWNDQWFTFEYVGRYASAVYFKSDDVAYFNIVPVENGNREKNLQAVREQCEVEKSWDEANYAF
jgi:hypothetical protein